MPKTKTTGFFFKMSQEEWDWVEKRMAQTNISNKSAYFRKMAIDGHVINLDTATIREVGMLIGITSRNVNQLAKRVNSGFGALREDVAGISKQFDEIRELFGKSLETLDGINNMKPGKLFIPPPRLRDFANAEGEPIQESTQQQDTVEGA
jgi:hypothetical protein